MPVAQGSERVGGEHHEAGFQEAGHQLGLVEQTVVVPALGVPAVLAVVPATGSGVCGVCGGLVVISVEVADAATPMPKKSQGRGSLIRSAAAAWCHSDARRRFRKMDNAMRQNSSFRRRKEEEGGGPRDDSFSGALQLMLETLRNRGWSAGARRGRWVRVVVWGSGLTGSCRGRG